MQVAMSEHAESQERQGHPLAKEDAAHFAVYVGEGVSHASYHKVLEGFCLLRERRLAEFCDEVAFTDEAQGKSDYCHV